MNVGLGQVSFILMDQNQSHVGGMHLLYVLEASVQSIHSEPDEPNQDANKSVKCSAIRYLVFNELMFGKFAKLLC